MKKLLFIIILLTILITTGFSQIIEFGASYDYISSLPIARIIFFPENPIGLQIQGSVESISADVRFRSVSKNKNKFEVDAFRYILLGCLFSQYNIENPMLNAGMGLIIVKWNGITIGLEGNLAFKINNNSFDPGLNDMLDYNSAIVPRLLMSLGYQL